MFLNTKKFFQPEKQAKKKQKPITKLHHRRSRLLCPLQITGRIEQNFALKNIQFSFEKNNTKL
ncbi:hypothetical protein EGY05_09225 [Chryseobacterium arthrosphaerae]|nr:hypothetical protein EGY05_09225 [Chryseobacterium arthrosphaerae]